MDVPTTNLNAPMLESTVQHPLKSEMNFAGEKDLNFVVECLVECAPNIALVKYWGKYDEQNMIPLNDSLGVTLNKKDLCTKTKCSFLTLSEHRLLLNGKAQKVTERHERVLEEAKRIVKESKYYSEEGWEEKKFLIQSWNNFPTASGLASSASGFACLAGSLNRMFPGAFSPTQISTLARLGSGSAARALHGGLVLWKGVNATQYLTSTKPPLCSFQPLPSPSYFYQLSADQSGKHFDEQSRFGGAGWSGTVVQTNKMSFLKVICLQTLDKQKQISSTEGMRRSVRTSELICNRNALAKKHIQQILYLINKMENATDWKYFDRFADVIMKVQNANIQV